MAKCQANSGSSMIVVVMIAMLLYTWNSRNRRCALMFLSICRIENEDNGRPVRQLSVLDVEADGSELDAHVVQGV